MGDSPSFFRINREIFVQLRHEKILNNLYSKFPGKPVLHRAEWIVPVSWQPVRNGAVLTADDRIVAAGEFHSLQQDCPAGTSVVDHGHVALMPALVNAHTHLDLSALKDAISFPRSGFPDWIGQLFSLRADTDIEAAENSFRQGEQEILHSGTALYGDVTNGTLVDYSGRELRPPERHVFLELLGFNLDSVSAALPPLDEFPENSPSLSLVPHSVYSVSPWIIAESKRWTRARGLPYSIHTAEHPEEIEFLQSGTGFCRELLEKLGRWDHSWKPPGKTPIEYLDGLGVLDWRTLLVHTVHMRDSDWDLAANRRCNVVFCPRSNRNLGAGRPDIEKALSRHMRAALGSDSLASNTDLSLFAEAAFVMENYPTIPPAAVLEMITINPAGALGREQDFGSIEEGKKAAILEVGIDSEVDESNIVEALIHSGKGGAYKWAIPAKS